jgi:anti-sigma factor ChrR (cupin superfamily)
VELTTLIHADLTERAVVETAALPWVPSPLAGVERKMLERDGGEVARATSVVRYAAGSAFDAHEHGGGEEFFVLEGVFSDESGDYPAGTYVRNPPGSRHRPFSREGCVLFVKLRQIAPDDSARVVIDTSKTPWQPYPGAEGLDMIALHTHGRERVYLARWAAGASYPMHRHAGGEESYVLSGEFGDNLGTYPAGTWIRNPVGSEHAPYSRSGSVLYVKSGHLLEPALWSRPAA